MSRSEELTFDHFIPSIIVNTGGSSIPMTLRASTQANPWFRRVPTAEHRGGCPHRRVPQLPQVQKHKGLLTLLQDFWHGRAEAATKVSTKRSAQYMGFAPVAACRLQSPLKIAPETWSRPLAPRSALRPTTSGSCEAATAWHSAWLLTPNLLLANRGSHGLTQRLP